jgi:hypothetical protein
MTYNNPKGAALYPNRLSTFSNASEKQFFNQGMKEKRE